ncbi:hypothetical protein CR513_44982, partial [Mucuna pruriens]
MLNTDEPSTVHKPESSALVMRGISSVDDKGKKTMTRETCWKIHGKPLNWKKKSTKSGHAFKSLHLLQRQISTYLTTTFYTKKNQNPWIIDPGETDHMTDCSKLFSSYSPCAGNKRIKIVDGTLSTIARS